MPGAKYERNLTLAIGQSHTVELPPRVFRVRLTGLLFETDKTFLLPIAMKGIRGLVDLYQDHPNMAVVVTGHTDRVGPDAYNLGLSDERAQSIAGYLKDDVDGWLKRYQKQPCSSPWGTREDQHMLSAILDDAGQPFYPRPVTGQLDAPTQDAVKRYQSARGLAVDGTPGPETRRALVTDYMKLDGTTLPASAQLDTLGCGENHNEVPTDDEVDEPQNRRVEIFLFDPPPPDPAVPAKCPGPGCPYPTWKQRAGETHDFDHDLCELLVEIVRGSDRTSPVAGARVRLSRAGFDTRRATSDEAGLAWFRRLTAGRYRVEVDKNGFQPAIREVDVRPGGGAASAAPTGDGQANAFAAGDGPGSGSGSGTPAAGSQPVLQVAIDPDSFVVKLVDAPWVTQQASEAAFSWQQEEVTISLSNDGKRTQSPGPDGVCTFAREQADHATLRYVRRTAPHLKNVHWRVVNFDEEPVVGGVNPHPRLDPGQPRDFQLSSRLRLSVWAFTPPLANADKSIDMDLVALMKKSRVDDLSLVYTISWDERDLLPNKTRGPVKPPKWHPHFTVRGYSYGSDPKADPKVREQPLIKYLQDLRAALQPEVSLQAGFEMVKRTLEKGQTETDPVMASAATDFANWLATADETAIGDYANALSDFFWSRDIAIDGIGFDFEIDALGDAHQANLGLLYAKTAAAFAGNNGFISYANAPFRAGITHYPGFMMAQPYSHAKGAPNIVARPMCFGDTSNISIDDMTASIAYALSKAEATGIHPSQLQLGVWADKVFSPGSPTGTDATVKFCEKVLRPNRVGLMVYNLPPVGYAAKAALYACARFDAALNPDEAPPGTEGQPLQVPCKWHP